MNSRNKAIQFELQIWKEFVNNLPEDVKNIHETRDVIWLQTLQVQQQLDYILSAYGAVIIIKYG